jgi:hypothetical protein
MEAATRTDIPRDRSEADFGLLQVMQYADAVHEVETIGFKPGEVGLHGLRFREAGTLQIRASGFHRGAEIDSHEVSGLAGSGV